MKRRIRITENTLHRIIKESVKRLLRESRREEYDWNFPEEYLPAIKKAEVDASWKEKDAADRNLKNASQIWDVDGDTYYNPNTNFGAGYEGHISGDEFDSISDDANNEYFEQGPYRFATNNRWEDEVFPMEDDEISDLFDPESIQNRSYRK